MPGTPASAAAICCAFSSFTARSGPTTLTVFSPLTPLIASSTLSAMYWLKLKVMPGNASDSSALSSSVSDALVTPLRHSLEGLSGAKSSMLLNPDGSVPSSGRPTCEMTVAISGRVRCVQGVASSCGQPMRMRRMRPTYLPLCSSDALMGNVPRIQKLPSSSLGMNSPPRSGAQPSAITMGAAASATASAGLRTAKPKSGAYRRRSLRTRNGSSLAGRSACPACAFKKRAASTGVSVTESTTAAPMAKA